MRHPLAEAWEQRLEALLQDVDRGLERAFGARFALHPSRPAAGETANRRYDGLFRITASFTAGFGSDFGPGYVLDIGIFTLEPVPDSDRAAIETKAVADIRAGLRRAFPGRNLRLIRDGAVWKITGDLSLHSPEDQP